MPIQAYPELSEVEVSLQDLAKIYDIYREQRTSRDEWCVEAKLFLRVQVTQDTKRVQIESRPSRAACRPQRQLVTALTDAI